MARRPGNANFRGPRFTILLAAFNWVFVLAVTGFLLWPPWILYSIDRLSISPQDSERSRHVPKEDILFKLSRFSFAIPIPENQDELIASADEIVYGRYPLQGAPAVRCELPSLWTADPFNDPTWRLLVQSWFPVRILLGAYDIRGEDKYLDAAGRLILSWTDWADGMPFGGHLRAGADYVWNDHAMAERTLALAQFWRHYRRADDYDSSKGRRVLEAVAQHAEFLRVSHHYSFLNNHGTMQNLALLHLAVAFPLVVDGSYVDVAVQRLNEQISLLISSEGLALEHSPGYHFLAIENLRSAASYLPLLGRDIPGAWRDTYCKMISALGQFMRPDGSLPPVGDTVEGSLVFGGLCRMRQLVETPLGKTSPKPCGSMLNWQPKRSSSTLWPWSGYAVYWDLLESDRRQLVATWSNFPGHAHKHADELSLYLYAAGRPWISGPGYWPYSASTRSYAVGWTGANSPYYEGEPESGSRNVRLVSYGNASWGNFIDMERDGPDGFRARRQVLWYRPDHLVVLDKVTAPPGRYIVVPWHFAPGLQVHSSSASLSWRFSDKKSGYALHLKTVGSDGLSGRIYVGNQAPFQGWTVREEGIVPAPTIELRCPNPEMWVASWFSLEDQAADRRIIPIDLNQMSITDQDDLWTMNLHCQPGNIMIERTSRSLRIHDNTHDKKREKDHVMPLLLVDSSIQDRQGYDRLKTILAEDYPYYGRHVGYRVKLGFLAVAVWLVQEIAVLFLKRKKRLRMVCLLRALSSITLLIGGVFLLQILPFGPWVRG